MQVTGNDQVELASYKLKVLLISCTHSGRIIGVLMLLLLLGIALVRQLLIGFFPIKLRESKVHEFMNLRQRNMMVQEYGLKLNQLFRYLLIWLLTLGLK